MFFDVVFNYCGGGLVDVVGVGEGVGVFVGGEVGLIVGVGDGDSVGWGGLVG